ncbi:hypothetical protein JOB18_032580 [Solea senegalensis]|uniref:Uncharacterized protein n=1 Tax=Solea senegalensis TaxID=28829 RepID=A0AAV6RLZ7_SOLSE|nr:hypothetical protein JOB18_032580 [Solea senegalensis]
MADAVDIVCVVNTLKTCAETRWRRRRSNRESESKVCWRDAAECVQPWIRADVRRETRASLDAHDSSMSSWKIVTFVGLLVSLISISKQDCSDYFNMNNWTKKHLIGSLPLVNAMDSNDIIECTLETACKKEETEEKDLLCPLQHCFTENTVEGTRRPLTCKNESSRNISFYHLHCMVARAARDVIVPEACNYDNVCPLYYMITPHDQTTTLPPTTTTTQSTTATTAAATTTKLRPAAVAANSSITTTTAATTSPVQGNAGKLNVEHQRNTDTAFFTMQSLLIISLILNVLLVVLVVMQWRMRPAVVRGNADSGENKNLTECDGDL